MRHFLDGNGKIRAIDYDQEILIQPDWSLLSDAELNNLLNPPKTTNQILCDCVDNLKQKRQIEQSSSVVVNGVDMQTDASSIAKMDQYATESMMNGLTEVYWEKADGTFHTWPIADFKKMFIEITKYENACFGRQSALLGEINAAPDPELVDISQGWPSKTITFV